MKPILRQLKILSGGSHQNTCWLCRSGWLCWNCWLFGIGEWAQLDLSIQPEEYFGHPSILITFCLLDLLKRNWCKKKKVKRNEHCDFFAAFLATFNKWCCLQINIFIAPIFLEVYSQQKSLVSSEICYWNINGSQNEPKTCKLTVYTLLFT